MQQQHRQSQSLPEGSTIAELFHRHASKLVTYVRRHVPTREDAEDVLLEVFLAALERNALVGLSEEEQLLWLQRVAHNKVVDYHRRAARRPVITLDDVAETMEDDEYLAPEQFALRHEEHALLRASLASLPETQQEVVRLRFAEGLRCTEIAKRLNKSDGAVRMLLSRSLNLLRNMYEKH